MKKRILNCPFCGDEFVIEHTYDDWDDDSTHEPIDYWTIWHKNWDGTTPISKRCLLDCLVITEWNTEQEAIDAINKRAFVPYILTDEERKAMEEYNPSLFED